MQTEQSYKRNPKALTQFQYCEENGIPLAVILGQSEIEAGIVKLRNVATREEVTAPKKDTDPKVCVKRLKIKETWIKYNL